MRADACSLFGYFGDHNTFDDMLQVELTELELIVQQKRQNGSGKKRKHSDDTDSLD